MSQWAEVRHLHLVEKRAEEGNCPAVAVGRQDRSPRRRPAGRAGAGVARRAPAAWTRGGRRLSSGSDQDRRLTAKRIRRLLLPLAGPVAARTVRRYVAALKAATAPKEAFVHRSVLAWHDDGGRRRRIVVRHCGGAACKVKYLVATLPSQQRVFRQGVSARAARVAARRHRIGVRVFRRRCGACRPGQHVAGGQGRCWPAGTGWRPRRSRRSGARIRSGPSAVRRRRAGRKGSVETGVKYVRNLVFRPRAATWRVGRRSTR